MAPTRAPNRSAARRPTIPDTLTLLLLVAWIIGFGALSARIASERGRSRAVWAMFGAIIGPIAPVLLRVGPPGRCAYCDSPTQGWSSMCRWCGNDVRGPTATALVADPVHPTIDPAVTSAKGAARRARTVGERLSGRRPTIAQAHQTAPAETVDSLEPSSKTSDVDASAAEPPSSTRTRSAGTKRPAAVARAPRGTGTEGGRRGAARSATPLPDEASPTAGAAPDPPAAVRPTVTLASGIFITGNVGLVAGSRYTIQVREERFEVMGPVDVDPTRVVLARPVDGMDATAFEGRLVISEPGKASGGVVLAFMSLAGGSPVDVAEALAKLAGLGTPT